MQSKQILRFMLTFIFSCFISCVAIATTTNSTEKQATFNIVTKIYVDGKFVSSPRIIFRAHQRAGIKADDLSMKLIASDASNTDKNGAIKINYDIQYKNGTHSKARLVVLPKQPAIIKFKNSGHLYELRVLAVREIA